MSSDATAVTRVVTDASIAIKWVVNESDSPTANALLSRWLAGGLQPIAPTFFAVEVANVLHRQALRSVITPDEADEAFRLVLRTVRLDDAPLQDTLRAMQIARALNVPTAYDALYLAVAEREGCEYWSADERFTNVATAQFPQVKQLGSP